jgi:hypothetical protein
MDLPMGRLRNLQRLGNWTHLQGDLRWQIGQGIG